ncbi:unnamed protein product [Menidia menidia]|uniref:(Atlantic silverside) hypothetical protein n=1 Tax=Menidia menidia TaxID=238744 RepID=A0A8S4BNJ4_9TELE|nr:unnamed protein product [Menidia menidia]
MSLFLFLLCVLSLPSVRSIWDGTCPRKDPPPGVLVLSPGNRVVLTCNGHVEVNGANINKKISSVAVTSATHKVTTPNEDSSKSNKTTIQNTQSEEHGSPPAEVGVSASPGETIKPRYTGTGYTASLTVQPTITSRELEDDSAWVDEEMDTEDEDNKGEEHNRVTRGIQFRPQWKWNKQPVGKGRRDWGNIKLSKDGAVLSLASVRLVDSGKYTCHYGDREIFAVKVIVADPPESPSITCYKRSPSSKIRCEWHPEKPIIKHPNCYLLLSKGPSHTSHFQQIPCSYSTQHSRCWCALDHNEDELRVLHMVFLCVTSILGNATSSLEYFTPLDLLKPDPPSSVSVHQKEGHERRMRITWNLPASWKERDNFYDIVYELKYRPLGSSEEQICEIQHRRSYTITDAMPGIDYLIQLRTKEEYDGQWSEWSSPVHARTWTAPETHGSVTPEDEMGSGFADIYPDGPTDQPYSSDSSFKHVLWIPVVFAFLSLILAVYLFRHRDRILSKLHNLNVITHCGDVSPTLPSPPSAPEGEALVAFVPQPCRDSLPSDTHEVEENEEGQLAMDMREAIHLDNTSYFFLQGSFECPERQEN